MNHLNTLVQREIDGGNLERARDMSERARVRAWILFNDLIRCGAQKPEGYCEPDGAACSWLTMELRRELSSDPSGAKLTEFVRLQKEKGVTREEAYERLMLLLGELNSIEPETDLIRQMTDSLQDVLDYVTGACSNSGLYPRD